MPAWDYQLPPRPDARPGERPPISEARLDIRIPEPSGRGRMINVDIGFADPYTVDLAELRRRAQKPGRAAADFVYISIRRILRGGTQRRTWCRSS